MPFAQLRIQNIFITSESFQYLFQLVPLLRGCHHSDLYPHGFVLSSFEIHIDGLILCRLSCLLLNIMLLKFFYVVVGIIILLLYCPVVFLLSEHTTICYLFSCW